MAALALEKAQRVFAAGHFERLGWAVFIAVAVFAIVHIIKIQIEIIWEKYPIKKIKNNI